MRIGYGKTSNPEGVPPSHGRMSQISCRGCRQWFTADHSVCPDCGWHRPAYSTYFRKVRMDNYLMAQRAKAIRER